MKINMIIGLVGYKGSGKTTACNIIKKHLDDVVQINFKDALIAEIKEKFPDLLGAILDNLNEECPPGSRPHNLQDLFDWKPPLVRTLMQNYGTDVRRKEDDDYWVRIWTSNMQLESATSDPFGLPKDVLTDDVRFHNEAKAIKGLGGILIRLERTDLKATDQHRSETEQKEIECDYTITCGAGELDKLETELIKILDSVR